MLVDRHSTDFGGNHGQGLLAIPHGPDLATNCARGRLAGPLSWLQVQGREEPHRFNGYMVMLEARRAEQAEQTSAIKFYGKISPGTVQPACAAAAGAHVERECPDRAKSGFPIRENGRRYLNPVIIGYYINAKLNGRATARHFARFELSLHSSRYRTSASASASVSASTFQVPSSTPAPSAQQSEAPPPH
jgi:hypothetical protein